MRYLDTESRELVGLPVGHAFVLACWSLFQPRETWTPLLLWGIWLPVLWLFFSPRMTVFVTAASTPFLLMHVFYRG